MLLYYIQCYYIIYNDLDNLMFIVIYILFLLFFFHLILFHSTFKSGHIL